MIIWGGGRTPEDARKALERFQAERQGLEAILAPEEGYPRVVASDTLPGLNPGFHVVVLGACAPQEVKDPLETLQAFKPGVYARPVKMALGAGSCLKHENKLKWMSSKRLTQKPFELTAAEFMAVGTSASARSAVPWLVRLYLRDGQGALVDQMAVDPRDGIWEGTDRNACSTDASVEGASMRVSVECERLAGGPGPTERQEEFEYRIKAGRIERVSRPE